MMPIYLANLLHTVRLQLSIVKKMHRLRCAKTS